MLFEWNEAKNRRNLAKHRVDFRTQEVFDDQWVKSVPERIVDGEQRWQSLRLIDGAVVMLVAHTCREKNGEEIDPHHLRPKGNPKRKEPV